MRNNRIVFCFLAIVLGFFGVARDAWAAGAFRLKSPEAQEVAGAWHLYTTIELPKPPLTAHQAMRFVFTKTVVYERSLVDDHEGPVTGRQVVQNLSPSSESLDVDFSDPSGKIFKATRFDFGVTRARGYEAGEYRVELKTSDGVAVGSVEHLVLKGDNPAVDRRSIAFSAKDPKVKKVGDLDAGAAASTAQRDYDASALPTGEVAASGNAPTFVPKEGYERTPEENIKTRPPSGCGCTEAGTRAPTASWSLVPLGAAVLIRLLRRRR